MAPRNMSADEILAELRGSTKTESPRSASSVDMDHIDGLIRDILTKQKERELKKTSDQFTLREKREIEKEVRVQTNSLTRKLEKMQKEATKARTAAIRVQLSGEVDIADVKEEPVSPEISLGMKTETFVALQQSRRQRAEEFVLDPAKPPQDDIMKMLFPEEKPAEKPAPDEKAAPAPALVKEPEEKPAEDTLAAALLAELPEAKPEVSEEVTPDVPEVTEAPKKEDTSTISAADLMAAATALKAKKEEKPFVVEMTEEPEAEAPVEAPVAEEAPIAPEVPVEEAPAGFVESAPAEPIANGFFAMKTQTTEKEYNYLYEDDDEYVSVEQKDMVFNRLKKQFHQAVASRLITAVTALLSIALAVVQFGSSNVWLLGVLKVSPIVYAVLCTAVLAAALAGSFPLFVGASRGVKKDTFALAASVTTLAVSLFFFFSPEILCTGYGVVYAPLMAICLFAAACGRVMRAKRIFTNFAQIMADEPMYGVILSDGSGVAHEMTRGLEIEEEIAIAANVPVDFIDGFITREQQDDPADEVSRPLMLTASGIGIGLAILVYLMTQDLYAAITMFSGSMVLGYGLILPMLCELPMHDSRAIFTAYESTLPDWTTITETSDANCVMLNATDLFPDGSVVLHGIKTFQGTRIDTAIVDAASVVCKADSVLRDVFLYIINNRTELLKPVDTIRYEDLMGLSAWVDEKRVLIGNRDLMINHSIAVPKRGYEEPYEEQGYEVVYLAREGELYAAFIIEFTADEKAAAVLSMMQRRDLHGIIRSVDSAITPKLLERVFELEPNDVKVIPARLHEAFDERLKLRERAESSLVNRGDNNAFIITAAACKQLLKTVKAGKVMAFLAAIILPLLLAMFLICNFMTAASAAVMGILSIAFFVLYWVRERNTKL